MAEPLARGPIAPAPPVTVAHGFQVSARRSTAALRIADCTPLTKTLVRDPALGVPFGRAARDERGVLVVGSRPGEWTLLAPPGTEVGADAVDLTSARALVRLTGPTAPALLAKVCAIDLDDAVTPDGAAFTSSVAKVVTDVVRDDRDGERSYLLSCERSYGQYLFDMLLDAGAEFGIDVDGYQDV